MKIKDSKMKGIYEKSLYHFNLKKLKKLNLITDD